MCYLPSSLASSRGYVGAIHFRKLKSLPLSENKSRRKEKTQTTEGQEILHSVLRWVVVAKIYTI
jgi:hypothetical protein